MTKSVSGDQTTTSEVEATHTICQDYLAVLLGYWMPGFDGAETT